MKTIPLVIRGKMPPPIAYNNVMSGLQFFFKAKYPDCISIGIKEVEIIQNGLLIKYAAGSSIPYMISGCNDTEPSLWVARIDYCAKDDATAQDIINNPFVCPAVGIHSAET